MPKRPFELGPRELAEKLEEMVEITISDLQSEFLLMPMGPAYIKYEDFRDAYECLKRNTQAFSVFTEAQIKEGLLENSRVLCIIRSILGMTPPEWAELGKSEYGFDIPQKIADQLKSQYRDKEPKL